MPSNRFPLTLLPEGFAVCKLDPDDEAPAALLADGGPFVTVTRTGEELSLVCAEAEAPSNALQVERGFRAFRLEGPVPFTTIGVVSGLTKPLAEAGISVFVVSTFDTDYLLVKGETVGRASRLLAKAGFSVSAADAD
ncbi:MAG TPA: ACT domain-containing protein [Candidatus Thermoplasmatota archaeon]|nr:ACT domain-containing protein [Candidatus Thermoplasmatota archaeon]